MKSKNQKQKITIIVLGTIVIVAICISFCFKNNNLKYDSVEKMKANLQGAWAICFKDGDSTGDKLIIDGNFGKMAIENIGVKYSAEINWHPSKGTIEWGSDKINVVNENLMESADRVYKKGSIPKTTYDFSGWQSNKDKEEKSSTLTISNLKLKHNSSYTVCTGSVTNNGKSTYLFVEVKGAFKNNNGSVIDTESAYACGGEGLAVGESSTFRMSVPKNIDIVNCEVSILDYTIEN